MGGVELNVRHVRSLVAIAACLGLVGMASHAAPPENKAAETAKPSKKSDLEPLAVCDATGTVVGRHFAWPSAVVMNLNGRSVAVELNNLSPGSYSPDADFSKTDFREWQLYFESGNCTGTAYVSLESVNVFGLQRGVMVRDGNGRRYIYPLVAGPARGLSLNSYYDLGMCHFAPGGGGSYYPTGTPVEVNNFVPPFEIR